MDGESEQSARLERERVLDMHARLAPYRERAFAVVGVTLAASGFWLGFWPIALLAVLFVAFRMVDGVTHRSPHPGRWAAATWAMSAFFIALIAALTGGVESPVAPALVLPIATLGARFDERA